jgi:transcriptional regulator with XRE-family HTH domain
MTDFGDELYRLLAERRLSLREAARRAGCSAGYLSNVAHGRKPLTPSVAVRLDRLLDTGGTFAAHALKPEQDHVATPGKELGQALGDSLQRSGQARRDDNHRAGNTVRVYRDPSPLPTWAATPAEAKRDAIRLWRNELDQSGTPAGTATVTASAILSWLTAPPDGVAGPTAQDKVIFQHDIKRVRTVRAWLKNLDNAHGGGVAFPLAVAYLRSEVAPLLRDPDHEGTGTALLAVIAEVELDTGWCAYDAGDHQLARMYLIHALRMAHAAGSRLLGARIICALSHQALHVGQVSLSVDLARAARTGAGVDATPRVTAMLAAMEGMAQAGIRDAVRCRQALNDAERALAEATADDGDPDWLDFDEGGLLGHTARALRDLAAAGLVAPNHARQCALRSVELCRTGHSRTRAQRNAILATTCVQTGDIDQAAAVGEMIIADAWDLHSRHVQNDIAALLASIEATRSRSAEGFSGQAREFLAARRSSIAPGAA